MNRLIQQRGFCKAQITRAYNHAVADLDPVTTIETLKYRLQKLLDNYEHFMELSAELHNFHGEVDYVDPEEDIDEYQEKHFHTHALLMKAIRDLEQSTTDISANEEPIKRLISTQTEFLERVRASQEKTDLHVASIKIPTFTGTYEDWPQFCDLFLGSIDSKINLTNCQKFHYLKSYLDGAALNLVKHIAVTDENYKQAWEKLVQRYNKKRLIVRSHITNFLTLPNANGTQVSSLRKLVDGADEAIRGLNALDCNLRDPWLIHILLAKLDPDTRQLWAETLDGSEYESINDFLQFLFSRCDSLESSQASISTSHNRRTATVHHTTAKSRKSDNRCVYCQQSHTISFCNQFRALEVPVRREFARNNRLCYNCLSRTHTVKECTSKFTCRLCKSKHHTLVHGSQPPAPQDNTITVQCANNSSLTSSAKTSDSTSAVVGHQILNTSSVYVTTLLPTILANVLDVWGTTTNCRILLDTGSTISLATESFIQRIGVSRTHARIPVLGLAANNAGVTRGRAQLQLYSRISSNSVEVTALIMSSLTSSIPAQRINTNQSVWSRIRQLQLADPSFDTPGPIDVIIGADQLWNLYTGEQRSFGNDCPVAINTPFGWVIAGPYNSFNDENVSVCAHFTHHADADLDVLVRSFMEMDSVQSDRSTLDASDPTEHHFASTHSRTQDEVYIVEYPFKDNAAPLGSTMQQALNRLTTLERKFRKFPLLKQQYVDFMDDYLRRGHMEQLNLEQIDNDPATSVYLPHHAVMKPDSTTTKCRVVFDGSSKDDSGISLNDRLQVGPPIQRDLIGVCLRFRQHRYVFCTDIEKMFRGILVTESHTNYQRIVWRKHEGEPIDYYRLLTVTYGLAPSPFLAVRVLRQLAEDYRFKYPLAAPVLALDAYVDDIPTGCDTSEELIALKTELFALLAEAKFNLRKWSSNCLPLLKSLPDDICEFKPLQFDTSDVDQFVKILGLHWCPTTDELFIKINTPQSIMHTPTKRKLLSELSKIYDPLGLVAPVTVLLKMLFQDSWLSGLQWDDLLNDNQQARWQAIVADLHKLPSHRIPRYIAAPCQSLELHGFADASSQAYAAVIYSRVKAETGCSVKLVIAKTRVAPVKPLSIPRLELNAAHLLTKLIALVKTSLTVPISRVYCWSDSQIVLHWLAAPPRKWATYVCNRTADILEVCPRTNWQHVRSEDNPADCASRGLLPTKLLAHDLWWNGPPWLSHPHGDWPTTRSVVVASDPDIVAEERKAKPPVLCVLREENAFELLINKISSWSRLLRIISYCYRLSYSYRKTLRFTTSIQQIPYVTSQELRHAHYQLLQHVQRSLFHKEYQQLSMNKPIHPKSRLLRYAPFLDEFGVMRVGGRIDKSALNYNSRHPILIPKNSPIATILVRHIHISNLHTGVDATFHIVRQQYWILGARNIIRKIVHQCKPCFMQRRSTSQQIMGDLPSVRVQQNKPFRHTGLDYAGPVPIKMSPGRTPRIGKAWFAIFVCIVCMTTKALHIEVVSNLTSDAFIAAFHRFSARRGTPSDLYSDNGTTFHGSKRQLDEMKKLAISHAMNEQLANTLAKEGVTWHFIPPSAPHFGGIWEAGVKSIKLHLKRVIGSSVLTFEEYATVLTQIERILNSRPISSAGDDSLDPLTPAHFLNGEPYTAVPEPSLLEQKINRLDRWRQLQAMVQGFWKRWHNEYLTSLQARNKWQTKGTDFKLGMIVVLKEPNLPPSKWMLGRIIDVHAGDDKTVRVVTVKTAYGTYKRPITKLAILPLC